MRIPPTTAAIAIAISCVMAACATTTSPTGRTQYVGAVSQAELDRMGAEAFAAQKKELRQSTDGAQVRYVSCVVNAIVRELPANQQRIAWESAVFVDANPNAFALPGGKVGVYTGIFTVARTQDQLAAVIAHEVGHVVANHHDERITRQMGAQAGLGVVGAVLGSRYGEGASNTTNQLGGAALQAAFLLPGSRDQESEADVVGQQLMAKAGFDPRQAVNLWQNMMSASGGGRAPQWLSTHPDPSARIGELQSRAVGLVPAWEQARAAGRRPACG